jgi:hypothetical protein
MSWQHWAWLITGELVLAVACLYIGYRVGRNSTAPRHRANRRPPAK